MITGSGKRIIVNKLAGFTEPCFDYLAVGTGAPVNASTEAVNYLGLQEMMFEVDRFPITSITPFGENVVHIVTEIPRALDIAVSELALFTHSGNTFSGSPSQLISGFISSEPWSHDSTPVGSLTDTYPPTVASGTEAYFVTRNQIESDNTYFREIVRAGSEGLAVFSQSTTPQTFSISRTLPSTNIIAEVGDAIRLAFILGYDTPQTNLSMSMTIASSASTQTIPKSIPINTPATTSYNASAVRPLTLAGDIPEYATIGSAATDALLQTVDVQYSSPNTSFDTTYSASLLGDGTSVTINPTDTPYDNQYMVIDFPISEQVNFQLPQTITIQISSFPASSRIIFDGLRFINKHNTNPYYGMTAYNVARNADRKPLVLDQSGSSIVGMEIKL